MSVQTLLLSVLPYDLPILTTLCSEDQNLLNATNILVHIWSLESRPFLSVQSQLVPFPDLWIPLY